MPSLLIKNGYIITMDKECKIIKDGAIYIENNKIISIGSSVDIQKEYSHSEDVIDATHKVIMPGYVNTHAHLPAHHLRGVYGRGMGGLYQITFPISKYICTEDSHLFALASCAEAIFAGSTTVVATHRNDTKNFDEFARAVDEIGMRVILGEIIPEADLYKLKDNIYEYHPEKADECIKRSIKLYKEWHGRANNRIKTILAPHAPDITTAETYIKCKEVSEKYNIDITTHLSQTWQEVTQVKKRYGKTPPEHLNDIGLLDDRLSVAHCTYATDKDEMLIKKSGAKILHCRAVFNPYVRWLDLGIPIGLGTDDVFHSVNELLRQNIYGSRFRARVVGGAAGRIGMRPSIIELLELSTIRGAEVMGIDDEVGSLEPGKKADILMYNMENPLLIPTLDPVSSIVLYATASDIDTVIIDGKIVKEKGVMKDLHIVDVLYKAQERIREIWDEFLKEDEALKIRLHKHIPYSY